MENVPCEWTRRQTLFILFPLIDNGCEEYVITLELLTAQISVVELLTPDTLVVGEPGRSAGKYLKIVINVLCLQTLKTFWRFQRQNLNGIFHYFKFLNLPIKISSEELSYLGIVSRRRIVSAAKVRIRLQRYLLHHLQPVQTVSSAIPGLKICSIDVELVLLEVSGRLLTRHKHFVTLHQLEISCYYEYSTQHFCSRFFRNVCFTTCSRRMYGLGQWEWQWYSFSSFFSQVKVCLGKGTIINTLICGWSSVNLFYINIMVTSPTNEVLGIIDSSGIVKTVGISMTHEGCSVVGREWTNCNVRIVFCTFQLK